MKKYLITGALALVASATFISCHTDDDFGGSIVEQKMQAYQEVFEEEFGKVDPNQDWGFGTAELLARTRTAMARTRTENANANEWADPDKAYGGLLVPPAITPTQAAVVKTYFQTHDKLGYEDPHWTNYFIQQVYKGHTSVPEGCATPEAYLAADGSNYILASDHMDHLIAVDTEKGIYDHINNFNHGDCSENSSVLDNGGNANDGPFHTDKIMYMMNSTTKSFGYHNSDGSLYHTEYTALVGWETIHDWAIENYDGYDNCLKDGWNRSFMGFDFEQMVGGDVYSKNGNTYNTFEFDGKTYNFLSSNMNMYAADRTENSYVQKNGSTSTSPGKANFNDRPSDAIIRDLISKGYLPYSDTLKDWVKVGGTADGYYSDWIVTLTEAKNEIIVDPTSFSLRVMAEDLSATERSDYDFNDVVFDVVWKVGDNYATIYLKAAGGTLPLRIGSTDGEGGIEVHEQFGVQTNIMVNTHWGGTNGVDGKTAQPFTVPFSVTASNADAGITTADFNAAVNTQISVEVEKLVNSSTGEKKWFGLYANQGQVCCKFGCPTTYNWVSERTNIDRVYQFSNWVQGFTTTLLPANQTNN